MKRMIMAALSIALAFTVAGCSSGSTKTASPNSSAGSEDSSSQKVTIRFWARTTDNFDKEIAGFQSKYPNIHVEYSGVGKDYDELMTKYLSGIAAKDLPDVAMIGQRNGIPQLYDSGMLEPIENFMSVSEQNDILPVYWVRFSYKGKRITVPFQSSMPILFYNQNILKEYNIANPPQNMDELMQDAKTIAAGGKYAGVNLNADMAWYIEAMVINEGSDIVKQDGSVSINNDGYRKVFERIKTMVHVDHSMPANQNSTARDDFCNGMTAFLFDSCASNSAVSKGVASKFAYSVALFPQAKKMGVPIGGNSLGIFKSTKAKEKAAYQLIQYLISPTSIAAGTMEKGYIPISNSSLTDPTVKAGMSNSIMKTVIGQVQYLKGQAVSPADSIIWTDTMSMLEKVESDSNVDINAQLKKAQSDVDKFMKDYKK